MKLRHTLITIILILSANLTFANTCGTIPFTVTVTPTDANCNGSCDGSVTANVTGGVGPFDYLWSPGGQTTATINGQCAGLYTVTVTDLGQAEICAENGTVNEPTLLGHTTVNVNPTCNGGCDGSITITPFGGVLPVVYSIDGGLTYQAANVFTGLCAGAYSIVVQDANGCVSNSLETLIDPAALIVTTSANDALCFNSCNGDITVSVSGGSPPYQYSLDCGITFQPGNFFTLLCANTYCIVVEDVNGCQGTINSTVNVPAQITGVPTITPPSTCGGSDASVSMAVSGGVPVYNYQWLDAALVPMGGETTAVITGITPGTYNLQVTDSNGCMDTIQVVVPDLMADATITPAGPFCESDPAFQYVAATGGGTWTANCGGCITSGGIFDPAVAGPGTHDITYTIPGPCGSQDIEPVTVMFQLDATIAPQLGGVCEDAAPFLVPVVDPGGTFSASCGGCISPTTGIFDPAAAGPGTHTIVYTIPGPCGDTDNEPYVVYGLPIVDSLTAMDATCGNCDGVASGFSSGGAQPHVYMWNDPLVQTTATATSLCSGSYTFLVVDNNGCIAQNAIVVNAATVCDSVWPGDTDYDNMADNNDLLPIGLGYGYTGPTRAGATLNWIGQVAQNYSDSLATGVNFKHSDTNGDAIVDDNDTLAILQNYGYVHAAGDGDEPEGGPSDPDIFLDIPVDTVNGGSLFTADVHLGNSSINANNVYGMAFTVHYDENLALDSASVYFTPNTSWFGTNGVDMIYIDYNIYSAGELDVALVRTNHLPVSGNGIIGTVNVVTTDNLSGKNDTSIAMNMYISDIRIIDEVGADIPVNTYGDSIVVDQISLGINNEHELLNNTLIYPNPASGTVNVDFGNVTSVRQISILDATGRTVETMPVYTTRLSIETEQWSSGVYYLRIEGAQTAVTKRVTIVK
jgi:hypothetical protein